MPCSVRRSLDGLRVRRSRRCRRGRAPMDIGEVDESQSALQSHIDWPGQWQVDEWHVNAVRN